MADNIIQNLFINGVTSTAALKKGLDAWAMRQRAHAQNIANAETPGYRRVVVDFEAKLKEALGGAGSEDIAQTDSRHRQMSNPDLSKLNPELRYMTAVELLQGRYDGLKSVIRGTSR